MHTNTIFHDLTSLISRHEFDELQNTYQGPKLRSANRWSQFIALLLNQILGLNGLRDVCEAMKAKANKMYHLGATPIARSTLARVNEQQNYEVFKNLFFKLYEKMQKVMPHSKFHLKGINEITLMDATTIKLCLEIFPWAEFRQKKGAIKLHVGLNDDGLIPTFCDMTTGKKHEINHAKEHDFKPGTMLVFDRGYTDYNWWDSLDKSGVYYVTRMKSSAVFELIERRPGPRPKKIQDDWKVRLKGSETLQRIVFFYDEEEKDEYAFITNAHHLNAKTIADLYKERWQIELFFKWIKQNLKIKGFLGTSPNAVLSQIWVALCVYLLLAYLKFKSKSELTLRNILAWIRLNLFNSENLEDFLIGRTRKPVETKQLCLI